LRRKAALLVVAGTLVVGVVTLLLILSSTTADSGTALANSYTGEGAFQQLYWPNRVAMLSGPQIVNGSSSSVRILSATPVTTGHCSMKVVNELAYNADSRPGGGGGWTGSGAWSAAYVLRKLGGDREYQPIQTQTFRPKDYSAWFPPFTISINNCRLHLNGVEFVYRSVGVTYHEFYAEPGTYIPDPHL
jgi:hypothetical protein